MQSMTNIAVFSVAQWGGTFDSFAELREVFALAKKNSGTLGFLPNSAFTDRGRIGHLLIGRIDDKVVGYCLFDVHRAGHIKLVHVEEAVANDLVIDSPDQQVTNPATICEC